MPTELSDEAKREIGQHFVFGFHGYDVSEDIKTLIRDYHLGHVILFKRNVQSESLPSGIEHVNQLVKELQTLAREAGHERPLMIGIDQENGLVSAFSSATAGTQFPGAMALAAAGSPDLAREVSEATGKELHLAGINWVYSPVADVNSDPRNPVIGVRSFGDVPAEAARYVRAVSAGLTAARIAPSAKHFPGHGNTHVDSHLSLPRILVDKAALSATELVPFRALVEDGIASIMTGHMALPLVTGDDTPCSLSMAITTDLLRGEMGYEGLIVTDCLEMEAVAEEYGSEGGAVLALKAGADVVMICHRMDRQAGAIEATYAAVQDGSLSLDALRASGTRVAALKDKFAGSWDEVFAPYNAEAAKALQERNAELSLRAYRSSIAYIPGSPRIPTPTKGPAILFTPQVERLNAAVDDADGVLRDAQGRLRNTVGPSYLSFRAALERRFDAVEHHVYGPEGAVPEGFAQHASAASVIVFATRNGFDKGAWQIALFRRILEAADAAGVRSRVVLVSTCGPYDLLALDLQELGVPGIATFEFTVPGLEAAAAVISGEVEAGGVVPVQMARN